jgi:hypothetical protein
MAAIPQPRPKHEPPADATLEWLVKDMWADIKELSGLSRDVVWLKRVIGILALVCGIYTITHGQDVIGALAKWAGLQ